MRMQIWQVVKKDNIKTNARILLLCVFEFDDECKFINKQSS